MTKARRMSLIVLLVCAGLSAMCAIVLQRLPQKGLVDFRTVYLGAKCLVEGRDPYDSAQVQAVYQAEGGQLPTKEPERSRFQSALLTVVYFPTALVFFAPFALLKWGAAQALWTILTIGLFTLASCLAWSLAGDASLALPTCLIAFVLANTEVLFAYGNAAGIAVSLCIIAVWCFCTERFVIAGLLCLAISLGMKPHDAAPVWAVLVFSGNLYRKRAIQTAVAFCLLTVPAVVWVSHVSPHWMQEIRSILNMVSQRGGSSDPGPFGMSNNTGGMLVDLQTIVSVFRDDPHVYNIVAYLICAPLLAVWLISSLRVRNRRDHIWFAFAALIPLSMLPVYHRPYDAKLLLLTVPACAMLWAAGGPKRWMALITTSAAIFVTSDIPVSLFLVLSRNLAAHRVSLSHQLLFLLLARPIPLVLLVTSIFYHWVYFSRASRRECQPDAKTLSHGSLV